MKAQRVTNGVVKDVYRGRKILKKARKYNIIIVK
jgi:hypothetical protein